MSCCMSTIAIGNMSTINILMLLTVCFACLYSHNGTMGAMNNFVRPEQQACVYLTKCVQFCCSGIILHIRSSQLLIVTSGLLLSMG